MNNENDSESKSPKVFFAETTDTKTEKIICRKFKKANTSTFHREFGFFFGK